MKGKETYIREVFTSMSATRFLARSSSSDGLDGALKEITELEGFD